MVTRLGLLARSTRDLINTLATIAGKGAGFRSLDNAWADTTAPHGRLMTTVLDGLVAFEAELIRARTGEGRKQAKARGVHLGRKPTLTSLQSRDALQALSAGTATQADLARRFNVSRSTISRLASRAADALTRSQAPRIDAETERAARVFLKRIEDKYPLHRCHSLRQPRARRSHAGERRRSRCCAHR